jgi:hypothetical protein
MSGDPAAALSMAGLAVPDDELGELSETYTSVRAAVELLYAPAFADADPYLIPTIDSGGTT